jgi:hypothetical protein
MLAGLQKSLPPRPSEWTFTTSNGGGLSVGFFGGEGGSITLAEPKTGRPVVFYYAAVGLGLSAGVKTTEGRQSPSSGTHGLFGVVHEHG